ncbi:MAG: hypothetical protein EOO52_08250 [Gammaproteobacteria bacterium]|nr:MAG: hypothetical protein EOO52_08250 [Gammaproteobacteria bacterium]
MKLYCSRNTPHKTRKYRFIHIAIVAVILFFNSLVFSANGATETNRATTLFSTTPFTSKTFLTVNETLKSEEINHISKTSRDSVNSNTHVNFNIHAGNLSDALRELCQQASLQLLYEPGALINKHAVQIKEKLTVEAALTKLLSGTDMDFHLINGKSVAISSKPKTIVSLGPNPSQEETESDVTVLTDVDVTGQSPWWVGSNTSSVFGFTKPLLDTPRSVSHVSSDAIDVFSLSAVEDLLRVVPGVFTTTRFGVQGSVDIRSVPADTYFRGMRRLTLQGHGRSVLAAMDSIEVVGGPASPLHGMGKIGGYVNFVPKSGRSKTGQYFNEAHGFAQLVAGQYNRRELSFGFGGPAGLESFGKDGGYYVYGLLEDSDSYTAAIPVKQKVFQAATSIDDMVGPFRFETGINFQESRTSGALIGRLTQALVDRGNYIGGSPLVNLDLNGNGSIGYLEMQTASPVKGNLTTSNQPLNQVFNWPTDPQGKPLTIDQFPKIAGIPQTFYDYLQVNPEADPTGVLRAQGVGAPIPVSGSVPVGMALDPRTVGINSLNPRRGAAYEKDVKARFTTAFADLVYDEDPDFTLKNQLFYDDMDQYKNSNQPFSQVQDVYVIEDKFTLTNRTENLPSWLSVNQAMSINLRNTVSKGTRIVGDYGNHRTDATAVDWNPATAGMTANTTFASSNENSDITNDGMPWGSIYRTEFSEFGAGFLLDIDVFSDTNILAGARHDRSKAKNTNYAGRYFYNTGTAANPGAYALMDDVAEAWDGGSSWSVSVSQQLPYGLHPYATVSQATILLDNNNNSLLNDVINAGHVGTATLKEAGVKGSWLEGRLSLASTVYEQGRADVSQTDIPNVINAYATATTTRGWQTEIKWVPRKNLLLSLYALNQTTKYLPNAGGIIQLDARALGFTDVLDAEGNLIYPAEAFLYGGRANIMLPNDLPEYERKQGNPETQMGVTVIYQFDKHWGVTLKGNYLSSTCAGRLCLVELPASTVVDLGLFWSSPAVDFKLDIANVGDKHYFRARTGEVLGDVIAQAMPGRRAQFTATYRF